MNTSRLGRSIGFEIVTERLEFVGTVDRERVREALLTRGVYPEVISLYGDTSLDTAFVLDHKGEDWTVGYYERGVPDTIETFATEDAACRRFADRVLSTRGTQPVD